MIERTFAVIKPDAVSGLKAGLIIALIEANKFNILRMEKTLINRKKAEEFYAVHKDKPFFEELVSFISSGPCIIMALEQENCIQNWRALMGATNPANASVGTIRKMFGASIGSNAVHGSDAPETAKTEISLFFPDLN